MPRTSHAKESVGVRIKEMNKSMPHQETRIGRHQRKIKAPSSGKAGAPKIYDAVRFPHMAMVLCKEYGFTDVQMAKVFGVSSKTIELWKATYPEFKAAIVAGKDAFDSQIVENALLKIALGYEYEERTVKSTRVRGRDTEGKVVSVPAKEITVSTKQLAPNAKAIALWLTNRNPERWKMVTTINANVNSKTETVTKTLQVSANLANMNSEQLRALRDMVSTQKESELIENNSDGIVMIDFLENARDMMDKDVIDITPQGDEDYA